jgi:hypothetical protein
MFLRLLPAVGASMISIWTAAMLAMPRRPLPNNEVEELVYSRLLGRQHRLILLAVIVTAIGFLVLILSMPSSFAARANSVRPRQQVCFNLPAAPPTCYTPQPGGAWLEEQMQPDGTWRAIGVSYSAPRAPGEKDSDLYP